MSVPAVTGPTPEPDDAAAHRSVRAAVDGDTFRHTIGHFASGVTVVTTRLDGIDHAMTASAFSSVSIQPVSVLVCVDKEARFRDAVLESGFWGVSVLSTAGRRAADWFATKGRPLVGQLDRFGHQRGPVTGAALLDDALVWLECRSLAVYDGGDHDIVLGEVVNLNLRDRDGAPLVYVRGRYGTTAT